MADSVTVDHGGVSITTNTASEADLRTEMTAPAEPTSPHSPPQSPTSESHTTPHDPTSGPARDEKGRFLKAETPQDIAPPENLPPAESPAEPARRRDDTLPRHNPIARLNQALAQKAEIERKAAQLEAELARYRQPSVSQPVSPAVTTGQEPQFEQFADAPDPYTAYLQAWTRWDRAQGIAQAKAEWEAAQTEKTRTQTFQTRLADGKTAYPDFDKVLTDADTLGLQVSAVMQEAIADSPHAADLVYYLATHPEECTQLAAETQYTPVAAATVMQRLLESHLAPRAAPSNGPGPAAKGLVSTAKPPVTPVGSSPVAMSDEKAMFSDDTSLAEHARLWNRRMRVPGTTK